MRINDHIINIKHGVNPCSLAYVMTLQGCKNMVKYFEENGYNRATDGNYNDYLEERKIFYGSSRVLVTGNSNLGSDIFG